MAAPKTNTAPAKSADVEATLANTPITDELIADINQRIKDAGTNMQKRRLFAQNRSNVMITHVAPMKYGEKKGGGVVKGGYNIVAVMSCKTSDYVGNDANGEARYKDEWAEVGTRNFSIWDEKDNRAGTDLYNLFNQPDVTSLLANLYWNFDGKTDDTEVVGDKRVFLRNRKPDLKVFSFDIIKENSGQANTDETIPF